VESLEGTPELPAPLRRQIHQRFSEAGMDVETWTQRCAAVLSHLTENMAIVTVPRASAPRLKHIQMVCLEDFLVMLIIVLQEACLLLRLAPLDERVDQNSWTGLPVP
jgi:heat-inducible transcriptional repressor